MTALALKHRPRVFADVAGQRPVAAVLWAIAERGQAPPGLLFHGPSGTGKTTMARIFGSALNCEAQDRRGVAWPCGRCASCLAIARGASLTVREVDSASYGSVSDVHALRERAMYGAAPGEHRVVILDECHAMSVAAFNALLKVLEEPPEGITWALLTTEPGKVLDTVNGRLLPFRFRRVPPREVVDRLLHICTSEGLSIDSELLALFAEQAGGQVRDAVMLLEQAAVVSITTVAQWRTLHGETDFAPALLAKAAAGDYAGARLVLRSVLEETSDYPWVAGQLAACLSDLLVLSRGAAVDAAGTALAARQDLASRLSPDRVASAMSVLWDLLSRVRVEDRRAGLELAVQEVTARLQPREFRPLGNGNGNGNGHGKPPVTQEELRNMFGATALCPAGARTPTGATPGAATTRASAARNCRIGITSRRRSASTGTQPPTRPSGPTPGLSWLARPWTQRSRHEVPGHRGSRLHRQLPGPQAGRRRPRRVRAGRHVPRAT